MFASAYSGVGLLAEAHLHVALTAASQLAQLATDLVKTRQGHPSRRGNTQRRAFKGGVIHTEVRNGRRYEYHATKGWRCRGRA